MCRILHVSIFFVLASLTYGLTTKLDNYEQFCTWKKLEPTVNLTGTYVVSGFNEEKVTTMVFTPSNKIIYKVDGQREGKFDITAEEDGEYRVCFRSGDRQEKFVSFDLQATNAKELNTTAATTKNIDTVYNSIRDAVFLLRRISRNQYFQNTRDNVHMRNMDGLEDKIQWSTFLKILTLAVIAVGQLFILTRFFKKRAAAKV